VVSPYYQGKHERQGGGEALSGGKVAAFVPPLVLLAIRRWAGRSSEIAIVTTGPKRAQTMPKDPESVRSSVQIL